MPRRLYLSLLLGLCAEKAAAEDPDVRTFYSRVVEHDRAWVSYLKSLCGGELNDRCIPSGLGNAGDFQRAGKTAKKLWRL